MAPESIKLVDLSEYHGITRIVLTTTDPAGLHYDDFSFDTPKGHVTINFNELATGTVVTNRYASATFNGGTVSDDGSDWTHVYKPPGGWGGNLVIVFKDPVDNLKFSTGWVSSPKGAKFAKISITTAKLLELTVADYDNPSNSKTAITGTNQHIYISENKDTGSAKIDVSTLFNASNGGNDVHIRVAYDDDGVIISDGKRTSLDALTLKVGDGGARDFVITAWVDSDGDGELGPDEDELEVDVSVVAPWSAQGTWAIGVESLVKANADGASLQQLAVDITGVASDASAFSNLGRITKGMVIDVTPLLKRLEQRLRTNIVEAARSDNLSKTTGFGSVAPPGYRMDEMGESQINSLFDTNGSLGFEVNYICNKMTFIIWARAIIKVLQLKEQNPIPKEFDKLIGHPSDLLSYRALKTDTPIGSLLPGDWAGFMNAPNCPDQIWQIENVIVLGPDSYFGWGVGEGSHLHFRQELLDAYNDAYDLYYYWPENRMYHVSLKDIPGYKGEAYFLDVPKLGQAIFNLRTKANK